MTVNIGLVTSDALVLGCDSVASTTEYFIDQNIPWVRDAQGKPIRDADGKFTVKFRYGDFRPVVTNAWGSVTKMFQIHGDPSPVVAVTAGLAKLNDRSIASHAAEFFANMQGRKTQRVSLDVICNDFLKFLRRPYAAHYKNSPLPKEFREGPEMLVGGFGKHDAFPSLYRIRVKENTVKTEFPEGKTGVSWNGQADAIERFIRGWDSFVRLSVEAEVKTVLKTHLAATQQYIADLVNDTLDQLKQTMPTGVKIEPPELGNINLPWKRFTMDVDYANLPLQEAVSFASAMVMTQVSKARFQVGVATVGGRTHIGVVTRDGYQTLNEPTLTHRYTGFADDS